MGLFKAIGDAVGSTLGDQWEDYIRCDSMDANTLIVRKTTESGQISAKSRIQVSDGQVAIIYDSGKVLDVTAEPGIYNFDASTSPTLFAGQFGDTLKEVWERIKYDGEPSKEQAVFYVNVKENMGNKFGTSTPMMYDDPVYTTLSIRYFGMYSFKIANPLTFFTNIAGNINDIYTKEQLMEQANAEFVNALDTTLSKCAVDGIKFSRLPGEQLRIAKYMNETLDEDWLQRRGMVVDSVAIEKITPDDDSKEKIRRYDNTVMYSKQEYAAGRFVDATAEAMIGAANNTNGATNGFVGLGMMNMTGNAMMGGQSPLNFTQPSQPQQQPVQQQAPVQPEVAPVNNVQKVCPNCGKPASGKFCSECGTPIPEEEGPKFCPNCGKPVTGKFCSECGTQC